MSLVDNGNSNGMVMPVSPMGGGYGNGANGFGGDGSFWIVVLFLFALMGNWGNNGNGGGYQMNIDNGMQRGFDQQSVMAGISGLNAALANAEVSRCNTQANILQAMNNNQNATTASMNSLAMALQNCCCENRAAVADLKYAMANEGCNTRNAISAGNQQILDKLCQLELDGIKQNYENRISDMQNTIDSLRNEVNAQNRAASQNAQTARILADNSAQTQALEHYLNPTPIPAYMVQNPNCCTTNYAGCGCNA